MNNQIPATVSAKQHIIGVLFYRATGGHIVQPVTRQAHALYEHLSTDAGGAIFVPDRLDPTETFDAVERVLSLADEAGLRVMTLG